jgi:hypothetical protein
MAKDKIGDEPNIAVYQVTIPQCYRINHPSTLLTKAANALAETKQEGLMYVIHHIVDYQTDGWGLTVTKTDLQTLFPYFTDLDTILADLEHKESIELYPNGYQTTDNEFSNKGIKIREAAVFQAIKLIATPSIFTPTTLTQYTSSLSSGLQGYYGNFYVYDENFGVKADVCKTIKVLTQNNLAVVVPPRQMTMTVHYSQMDSGDFISVMPPTNLNYILLHDALNISQEQTLMIKEMKAR